MKLDYTLTNAEDRVRHVEEIIASKESGSFTNKALEIMANYILFTMTKEEKRNKTILTDNRQTTMKKREMSYEGLSDKLEQGGSSIQPLIANDKNIIFSHAISITPKEVEEIPYMKQLRESIDKLEGGEYSGREAFVVKKAIIELRQDQYILKQHYKQPTRLQQKTKNNYNIDWHADISIDKDGNISAEGLCTLLDTKHVKALLSTYKYLKPEVPKSSDLYYLVEELDMIIDALPAMLRDLARMKMSEETNQTIQDYLKQEYQITHSLEYLSSLWQNKIPKQIAAIAQERWLNWFYENQEKGTWKTCSRCEETKLAHPLYFSKNKGYYSICKSCRNIKNQST